MSETTNKEVEKKDLSTMTPEEKSAAGIHPHGTRIIYAPQTVKELFKYVQSLEARVAYLEDSIKPKV